MVVSLPSNPVGSIATPGLYEEIVAFAKKYDILIIHDNAYSDIIFDGVEGGSFLATPGAREVGVEFFSLSKSFNAVSYTHLLGILCPVDVDCLASGDVFALTSGLGIYVQITIWIIWNIVGIL